MTPLLRAPSTDSRLPDRADATIAAQATGAMSWAFITALKKNPQQSYVQLLNSIRDELASRYTQRPQLSSSHPLSKCCVQPHSLDLLFVSVLL
jgi:hypothetical protein